MSRTRPLPSTSLFFPIVIAAFLAAAPAAAQGSGADAPERRSILYGDGESYWGAIPAPGDSTRVVFENRRTPVWRSALYLPFRIVLLPLWLVDRVTALGFNSMWALGVFEEFGAVGGLPGPWRTVFQPVIRAGGLPGFGLGVRWVAPDFFGPQNTANLELSTTTRGDTKVTAGALFRGKRGGQLELGVGSRDRPNARFFGVGPNSLEENESFYHQNTLWAGARWRRPLVDHLFLELQGIVSSTLADTADADNLDDDDRNRTIQKVFPVELIPGFGKRVRGVDLSISFAIETVVDNGRPRSGGIYRVKGQGFSDFDDNDLRFWNLRGEIQQFIPLWNSNQTFAVRTFASWLENVGSDPIPFQRLLSNDSPDEFRGYKEFRWRDIGLIAASFEYRWPVWVAQRPEGFGADAYLLSDVGQVFNEAGDIATKNLTVSYGLGFRLVTTPSFVFRMEIARSEEETVFRFEGTQLFQFFERALLNGEEPIPSK